MTHSEQKTGALGFNFRQTKTFLDAAFPGGPQKNFLELRLLNNKRRPRVKQFWLGQGNQIDWQEVEHLNAQGWNVYFGPALRKEKKGTRKAVAQVSILGVDLDVKGPTYPNATFINKRAAFLAFVERLPKELFPSAIEDTGHGLQAFWFLQEPLNVADGTGARVEQTLRGLTSLLGADPRWELNAVFRLPGSWNIKDPANPRPVRLIWVRATLSSYAAALVVAHEARHAFQQLRWGRPPAGGYQKLRAWMREMDRNAVHYEAKMSRLAYELEKKHKRRNRK